MRRDALPVLTLTTALSMMACSSGNVSVTDGRLTDAAAPEMVAADTTVDSTPRSDVGSDRSRDLGGPMDSTIDHAAADRGAGDQTGVDRGADVVGATDVVLSDVAAEAGGEDAAVVDGGQVEAGTSGYVIAGTISQGGGATTGVDVIIRLYPTNATEALPHHVAEQTVAAEDGVALAATAFLFRVDSPGSYYVRAFRDSAGPLGAAADGEPTLETDAQTPARQVDVVDADVTGVTLLLRARTNDTDFYVGMNAYTYNESPLAHPPRRPNGDFNLAGGFCGGFTMRLNGYATNSGSALLGPLYAERPDGQRVQLVDDGGCGASVADNSASSYDRDAADGELSYGFADPGPVDAGDYTFFYRQTQDDFIHIQRDSIAQVVKLSMARDGLTPSGAAVVGQRRPTFFWNAVSGAAFYELLLFQSDGSWDNLDDDGAAGPTPSYTPAADLADDACFAAMIIAADASWVDGDPDAVSVSGATSFCVDVDGQDTVTISGAIDDRSNSAARVAVAVSTDTNATASVWLPAGQVNYSLGVLSGGVAQVDAFVDADGNGRFDSPGNSARRATTLELGALQANVTGADLRINPALQCTAPPYWSSEPAPVLRWNDYATTASPNAPTTAGALLLILDDVNDDGVDTPLGMWLLPGDQTQLDLAQPPTPAGSYDYLALITCAGNGGTVDVDFAGNISCTGATAQSSSAAVHSGHGYYWTLQVIDCPFAAYDDLGAVAFFTCLTSGAGAYAYSEARTFIAQ